jgi:hypothetical protein
MSGRHGQADGAGATYAKGVLMGVAEPDYPRPV